MKRRIRKTRWMYFVSALPLAAVAGSTAWLCVARPVVDVALAEAPSATDWERPAMQALSQALDENPQAERFRVRWTLSDDRHGAVHCALRYDRAAGQMSTLEFSSGLRRSQLCYNVSPETIRAASRAGWHAAGSWEYTFGTEQGLMFGLSGLLR